jgi:hypothetical protein
VGSNPAHGMEFARFLLCCPLMVGNLDLPSVLKRF